MKLSVVIPTYKRPHYLSRCLSSLSTQTLAPDEFEICVVSDGPDEETARVVRFFAGLHTPVRLLVLPAKRGPAAARNLGWKHAQAPVIAFTDDDTIPYPSWLAEGYRAMAGTIDAASGTIVVPTSAAPTDYEVTTGRLRHAEFATANCFYRKSVLHKLGGFDERFTQAWREDSDLYFSALERHIPVGKADAAIVLHPVRPHGWGVSIQEQTKSRFNALLYKKHPFLYQRSVQHIPSWRYIIIVSSFLTIVLALVTRSSAAAIGASAVWVIATARFFLIRIRKTAWTAAHIADMAVTSVLIPFLSLFWRAYGAIVYRVFFL